MSVSVEPETKLVSKTPALQKIRRINGNYFEAMNGTNTTFYSEVEPWKFGVERISSDFICFVCCSTEANAVMASCLHGGICKLCALNILNTRGECSLCRKKSNSILLIEEETDDIYTIKTQIELSRAT